MITGIFMRLDDLSLAGFNKAPLPYLSGCATYNSHICLTKFLVMSWKSSILKHHLLSHLQVHLTSEIAGKF